MFVKRYFTTIVVLCFLAPNILYAQNNSISAETFARLPDIYDIQISPDGSKIMVMQNIKGRMTIVTRDLSRPSSPFGIPPGAGEYNWARWTSNDKILASLFFPSARNNGVGLTETNETRLVYMDWDGSNKINPVDMSPRLSPTRTYVGLPYVPQIQDDVIDFLQDDPSHIILELDQETPLFDTVYKLNLKTKKSDRLMRAKSPIQDWKLDFNKVVRFGEGRDRKSYLSEVLYKGIYRKDEKSNWITLFEFDELTENKPFEFEGYTIDPDIIYISKANEFGRNALYKYDVDNLQVIEL